MTDFLSILGAAFSDDFRNWAVFLLFLSALVAIGVLVQYLRQRGIVLIESANAPSMGRAAVGTMLTALVLIMLSGGFPFYLDLGHRVQGYVATISSERLNRVDQDQMEAGYYEGLLDMGGYTSALAQINGRKPSSWLNLRETDLVQRVDDVAEFELVPNAQGVFKGAEFRTNEWGMHDQAYALQKNPGVFRMALLGASYAMGSGVQRHESWEAVLEQQLNAHSAEAFFDEFEILNFAVGGYSLLHQAAIVSEKVLRFSPDVVVVAVHATEASRLRGHLMSLVREEHDIQFPAVRSTLEGTGVVPDMVRGEMVKRITPVVADIEMWSIQKLASDLRARGVALVAVYVPITLEYEGVDKENRDRLKALFESADVKFLEIKNPFLTDNIRALQLADWDAHPTAEGNDLIAEKMYELMIQRPDAFNLEGANLKRAEFVRPVRQPNTH